MLFSLFFSCNADINVALKVDSSGEAEVKVNLHPIFVEYIRGLIQLYVDVSEDEITQLIDINKLKAQLEKSDTVSLLSLESNELKEMNLKLAFKPLDVVLDEGNRLLDKNVQEGIRKVMDIEVSKDGVKKVSFYLDRHNFFTLSEILPPEIQPLLNNFSPPMDDDEEEEWFLSIKDNFSGFENSVDDLDALFFNSKFTLNIDFAGELVSYSGGEYENGILSVEVSLYDLLYLKEPFYFEVEFK